MPQESDNSLLLDRAVLLACGLDYFLIHEAEIPENSQRPLPIPRVPGLHDERHPIYCHAYQTLDDKHAQ